MKLRSHPAWILAGILSFALVGFLFSCSEDPVDIGGDGDMSSSGDIDPAGDTDFLLSTVDPGYDITGRLEVWVYGLTVEGDSAVSFDLAIANRTDRDAYPPIHFIITKLIPGTVTVLNPDDFTEDGMPFFDFSDDIGDDDVLSAGEMSSRVNVRFGWPHPMPFALGFKLRIGHKPLEGAIGGVVFKDENRDGMYQPEHERGIPGIPIEIRPAGDGASRPPRVVETDREGRYLYAGLNAGVYTVKIMSPPGMALTTPRELLVTLIELPDGMVGNFLDAHFGATPLVPPFETLFGPVPVGPGSPFGERVDTLVVVPPPDPTFRAVDYVYFVRVEPPMLMGPYPLYISKAAVQIDEELVFKYECGPEGFCPPPAARVMLERGTDLAGEHRLVMDVMGEDRSFLMISLEREWREIEDK